MGELRRAWNTRRELENRRPNDPHVATDWKPSSSNREAYKDEATRIGRDGVDKAGTYNKINSPGHAYMKEDGEWP